MACPSSSFTGVEMTSIPVRFQAFYGGWSTDLKVGQKASQAFTQGLDFRKNPSQLSVLPGPSREDNGVIKDLILNEVMTSDGSIYAFGNAGFIYKRSTAGAWSSIGSMKAGTGGVDWRPDTDSIYFTSTKFVGLYAPLSTIPMLTSRKYADSYSTSNNSDILGFNVSAFQQGSSSTTVLATSIVEQQSNLRYFQSDIEPLNKISVFIVSKGSGDWTLTLHDGDNNVLGSATVANASLNNNTFNDFVFANASNGQVRIYVSPNARTYHIHVTSTVANGTISSSASNNMSTCDLEVWADRLIVTTNGLHPMARFQQYEVFGNGNYLSVWEPISDPPTNEEWLRHRLTFPSNLEVCGIAVLNEFLAIACERVPVPGNNPGASSGVIFWWDGLSDTYNYFTDIPEGSPYGLHQYENNVYYYAGGAQYAIAGANSVPVKIRTMPGTDTEFSSANAPIVVYPYTASVRRGIHLLGWPSTTTNSNINYGVYSWGSVDKNYPASFGYNYTLSTGNQNYSSGNNLQIGMVKSFGDLLHISWRDDTAAGSHYGIDVVSNLSTPAPTAKWESLIIDNGYAGKTKTANYVEAYFPNLPSGATIQLKYKIDRAATWTYDDNIYSSTNTWQGNSNYATFDIAGSSSTGGIFYEIQVGFEITCDNTVTVPPLVAMVGFVFDDQRGSVLR